MSHFTTVKTLIMDKTLLCEALRDLHYAFREGENLTVRGDMNERERAQVVVDTGCAYDIGFQHQTNQFFAVCADWRGVQNNSPIRQDNFLRKVNQRYTYHAVKEQVKKQNYMIEEERVLENGEIEIIVCEPL